MDAFVVSHTHWDREWYQPLGVMRQRLVALLDELTGSTDGGSFLLDGQAVVLNDYLQLRPGRAPELAAALRSGRLEVGPWYVLADALIPGGEALIRNLMAGRRAVEQLAGSDAVVSAIPPVLYCPDSFGHPAILPELARGFGLSTIIVWRGHGGEGDPPTAATHWIGRDGERVLLYHLTRSGYELGANLPVEAGAAAARWQELHAQLGERDNTGLALLLNGADHHLPQRDRDAALEALKLAAEPHSVREASLSTFARELQTRARQMALPTVTGERRNSYGYTWTLQGTHSCRAAQKRMNARAERLLVSGAEPWAALALALNPADEQAQRVSTALLPEAWRTLLECHPHDTLCGCSVDAVARAMDVRLESAIAQARRIRQDALALLLGADPDAGRGRNARWRPGLVLMNPAARSRGGVIEVEVLETIADEPVGPGSAPAWATADSDAPGATSDHVSLAADSPFVQVISTRVRRERLEPLRAYPDNDIVRSTRALVWCQDPLPPLGLRTLPLHSQHGAEPSLWPSLARALGGAGSGGEHQPELPPRCSADHAPDGTVRVANGIVTVTVGPDGKVTLTRHEGSSGLPALSKANGATGEDPQPSRGKGTNPDSYPTPPVGESPSHTIESLCHFDWVRDVGDLYTHQPTGEVRTSWDMRAMKVIHKGPLRAELAMDLVLSVPRSASDTREVKLPIRVSLHIDAGSPLVHVRVRGRNRARDHRLRLGVRTGVAAASVSADAAFLPVARTPIQVTEASKAMESPPPTAPLHRYVTLRGGSERAVSVISDGLAEYEATAAGDVFVTLVRAVGELSRNDLSNRPGHAGWPASTPMAQSLGSFSANFAVLVHPRDPETVAMDAEHAAEDALVPPRGATWRWLLNEPRAVEGFRLEGDGLVLRAIMPVAGAVQLRCVNLHDRKVAGAWHVPREIHLEGANRVRLDGTLLEPLEHDSGTIAFEAAPHEMVTIALRLATPG